jgi:thymidylate kinase
MFIIFEGMDNVGKTTHINRLEEYFANKGILVHKLRYNNVHVPSAIHEKYALAQYMDILAITAKATSSVFIADRFHLGEFVYGQLYRDYCSDYLSVEKGYELDLKLFYLWAPIDNLVNRDDGKSLAITREDRETEAKMFMTAYQNSMILDKIAINTMYPINDVYTVIEQCAQSWIPWKQ